MAVDQEKLQAFLETFARDLGATIHAATVALGDELGLYRALAAGPQTAAELAERAGCQPRLVEEWLNAQAASAYCQYEPATRRYSLTEEQAACLADESSPAFVAGGMQIANLTHRDLDLVRGAFESDGGLGWHEHHSDLFSGTDRFFRPRYAANLVDAWIPALDGVADRLRSGGRVADIGCGYGATTILMARAYPASTFHGFDYHAESVEAARKAASEAGVSDRVTFEIAGAEDFPGADYDLVCIFNAFHEFGDPVGAARRIRAALTPGGRWLLVEPYAADRVEDNYTDLGRNFYSISTLVCVPNALSQGATRALGAQAGEAALARVATEAGFTRVRRAAENPMNLVLEATP
jgi:SAM-dependent methyltransferase